VKAPAMTTASIVRSVTSPPTNLAHPPVPSIVDALAPGSGRPDVERHDFGRVPEVGVGREHAQVMA
jgi:hypothetical protein